MYRWFLSLRYLRARRTNWIGAAGITVAVAALILILSIMSGFLQESRNHLRGNLGDLIIMPNQDSPLSGSGRVLPKTDEAAMMEIVRANPHVSGASLQMAWYGMLVPDSKSALLKHPVFGDLSLIHLVGIDVPDEYGASDLQDCHDGHASLWLRPSLVETMCTELVPGLYSRVPPQQPVG